MSIEKRFDNMGIKIPDILLPRKNIDLTKWAVVACDQYTSEPEYWKRVEERVGDSPSTLHLIYPEVYLQKPDKQKRIQGINAAMDNYLQEGVFRTLPESFIYLRRSLPAGGVRQGLVLALDLERYSYEKGAESLIRATEGTILDRLPPRIEIRKQAPIELPHIMVLINDKENALFSRLEQQRSFLEQCYSFELMEGGGKAEGYRVAGTDELASIAESFENLLRQAEERDGASPLLFAMGDGNHSFATAKAIWEETKMKTGDMNHPSRWALVEIVNIYDSGLLFEPIHRLVMGFGIGELRDCLASKKGISLEQTNSYRKAADGISGEGEHRIAVVSKDFTGVLKFPDPEYNLAAANLDLLLEECLSQSSEIDYIHGAETARNLAGKEDRISFILPDFKKEQLFPTVIKDGALPRKTFSMGEAAEKRYYLEARKIV